MAVPCSTYFPLCTEEGNGVADCKKKCQNKRGFRNQVTGGNDPIGPVANPLGCTMASAANHNPSATQEDGSCMWYTRHNGAWVAMGCDGWTPDLGYVDYDYGSDFIAVNQCPLVNYGCLDPSADNYNPSADQDWTMGGTTLCVYGGSVGTLTGTKDPKKGMRSATGRSPLSRASNWKTCDCGMNSRPCNMDVYASCTDCCNAVSSDKMRSATGSRPCTEWGFSAFSSCRDMIGTEQECRDACTERPSGRSKMRSATGRRFTSHWGGLKMR